MTEPTTSTEKPPLSHWARDEAEEDRVETLIRRSGCWDQHLAVVDCMAERKDWRQCQEQLNKFRECMVEARKQEVPKEAPPKPVEEPKEEKKVKRFWLF